MNYKCKCGSMDFFTEPQGNNIGLYCSMCGKWKKWLGKDEAFLFQHNQASEKSKYKTYTIEFIGKTTIKAKSFDDVKEKFNNNDFVLEDKELKIIQRYIDDDFVNELLDE